MVVLGIDPGLASTGWGVVDKSEIKNQRSKIRTEKLKVLGYGVIKTKPGVKRAERLKKIYEELSGLIEKYQPELVVVEEVFFGKNAKTAMMVGQAQGVIMLAAVNLERPVLVVTPLQVKNAVCGYGRAEKGQVQAMVQRQLGMGEKPKSDDAADALAVALTAAVTPVPESPGLLGRGVLTNQYL